MDRYIKEEQSLQETGNAITPSNITEQHEHSYIKEEHEKMKRQEAQNSLQETGNAITPSNTFAETVIDEQGDENFETMYKEAKTCTAATSDLKNDVAVLETKGQKNLESAESWQLKCKRLSDQLGALLARNMWYDCQLVVGKELTPIQAHRVIIASASPVLANMLYNTDLGNPDNPIRLINIDPYIFKLVLKHIYTHEIVMKTCEIACSLFEAAKFLTLPYLEIKCRIFLLAKVSPNDVLGVYEFAQKSKEKALTNKCLDIIAHDSEAVLEGNEIEMAQADTIEMLFALPNLNIKSELELVEAAKRWVLAHHNSKMMMNEVNGVDQEKGEVLKVKDEYKNPKSLIKKALQQIRFLAMKPDEFANNDMSSLLNNDEILAISMNLNSSKTFMPMPKGFSTIKA